MILLQIINSLLFGNIETYGERHMMGIRNIILDRCPRGDYFLDTKPWIHGEDSYTDIPSRLIFGVSYLTPNPDHEMDAMTRLCFWTPSERKFMDEIVTEMVSTSEIIENASISKTCSIGHYLFLLGGGDDRGFSNSLIYMAYLPHGFVGHNTRFLDEPILVSTSYGDITSWRVDIDFSHRQ